MKKLGLLGIVLMLFTSCPEPFELETDPRDGYIEIYSDGAWRDVNWSSDANDYTIIDDQTEANNNRYHIYAIEDTQIYVNLYIDMIFATSGGVNAEVLKSPLPTRLYGLNEGSYEEEVPTSTENGSGTLVAAIPSNATDLPEPGNPNSNKQLLDLESGYIYILEIGGGGAPGSTINAANIEAYLVP
jgi:hypothetical protein